MAAGFDEGFGVKAADGRQPLIKRADPDPKDGEDGDSRRKKSQEGEKEAEAS